MLRTFYDALIGWLFLSFASDKKKLRSNAHKLKSIFIRQRAKEILTSNTHTRVQWELRFTLYQSKDISILNTQFSNTIPQRPLSCE